LHKSFKPVLFHFLYLSGYVARRVAAPTDRL
jgi:hypothetical protein